MRKIALALALLAASLSSAQTLVNPQNTLKVLSLPTDTLYRVYTPTSSGVVVSTRLLPAGTKVLVDSKGKAKLLASTNERIELVVDNDYTGAATSTALFAGGAGLAAVIANNVRDNDSNAVPEPVTMVALGLGTLAVLRRRK